MTRGIGGVGGTLKTKQNNSKLHQSKSRTMAQFKKKEGKILILKFLTELPTGICISYFFLSDFCPLCVILLREWPKGLLFYEFF